MQNQKKIHTCTSKFSAVPSDLKNPSRVRSLSDAVVFGVDLHTVCEIGGWKSENQKTRLGLGWHYCLCSRSAHGISATDLRICKSLAMARDVEVLQSLV